MMVSYSALKKVGKRNVKFRRSGTLSSDLYNNLLHNIRNHTPCLRSVHLLAAMTQPKNSIQMAQQCIREIEQYKTLK